MVHSVAGMLDGGRLVKRPPYREPHHSASQAALTSGGCEIHRSVRLSIRSRDSPMHKHSMVFESAVGATCLGFAA